MKKVKVISVYPSEDIHCTNDPLCRYVFLQGKCVTNGNNIEHVAQKVTGALAMIEALGIPHEVEFISISNSHLFYKNIHSPDEVIKEVCPEPVKTQESMYGNF
jgi:hypothetical protein